MERTLPTNGSKLTFGLLEDASDPSVRGVGGRKGAE
jgi:hypothetical protein